ncbi:MAG TPA: lysophospholipid acyltransferase family protein [Terriglobales bacterium]|nr:lysophospholipid acyltransferase family protein [Terriglobales bacterium]
MLCFLRQAIRLLWTVAQALADGLRRNRPLDERADWMHAWTALCLKRLRIQYTCIGSPPSSGLIVSNHLGYLDVMIFGAVVRCIFVSKAEVSSWPVFGRLATLGGTVYVDRKRRSGTRNANQGISNALRHSLPVVIFPEGTSSGGNEVLPFYPSLFEPAVENRLPVTAAHLSYEVEGGTVERDVAYWGTMTFFPHLLRLLSLRNVRAVIRFSDAPRVFTDRKIAAEATRTEVLRLRDG